MHDYDVIVIGAGPGGYVAAIKAAQKGLKTALIEKDSIGGACLNWGCIPTKAMMKSVKVYHEMQNAKDYGLVLDKSQIGFDWGSVLKRKDLIVKRLTGGVGMLLKKNGVTVIQGEAKVLENKDVLVDGKTYSAKNLILSTGSSPLFPEIKGLKESYDSGFLKTNRELMDIDRVPETLVIIGGYITNIPIASIFAGFGTQVTILENKKTLLPELDEDTRDVLMKSLKKSKINLYTETSVKSLGNQEVIYQNKDGESLSIKADTVLLSMDMKANTECFKELKLKSAGGFISVDKHLETSMKHVYAIGDVNGKMMLAHVASHQALIAVNHILGIDEEIDYDQVPQVVYGFPEIAYVGLSEQEAKKRQIEYKISKFPLQANGRALAGGEREGFIKILAEPKYNQIIGVHIVAENASDLISEAIMTMKLEGTAEELAKAVHPHPALSEIYGEAALGIYELPIHI